MAMEFPGDCVGPYQIIEQLGQGGMGIVYRALDKRLGREVALKVLRPEGASDPAGQRRIRREATAIAALNRLEMLFGPSTVHGASLQS